MGGHVAVVASAAAAAAAAAAAVRGERGGSISCLQTREHMHIGKGASPAAAADEHAIAGENMAILSLRPWWRHVVGDMPVRVPRRKQARDFAIAERELLAVVHVHGRGVDGVDLSLNGAAVAE